MEAKAVLRYVRISPRKARKVTDLIRGKNVNEAIDILAYTPRAAAKVVEKVLKSAIANAGENRSIQAIDTLVVSRATVDPGPTLKRFMPRARGRATPVRKRTSHITLVLEEQP